METTLERLKRFRQTLAPEEWRDVKMYVHNDVEFEHFSLIATNVNSGKVHYYNLGTEEFNPLPGPG